MAQWVDVSFLLMEGCMLPKISASRIERRSVSIVFGTENFRAVNYCFAVQGTFMGVKSMLLGFTSSKMHN